MVHRRHAGFAFLAACLLLSFAGSAQAKPDFKAVAFPSQDGLEITADLYAPLPRTAPLVVLFHQAGWSRGEYRDIAPRLNRMGVNVLAVDLRSGKAVNGVENQTAQRAAAAKKGISYVDALPDMKAALTFARKRTDGRVIAWGSSYSAALVLYLAGQSPQLIDVAIAFAPGEYFEKLGKPKTWIRDAAKNIQQPTFITSAKKEAGNWKPIFAAIPGEKKTAFVPKTPGNHGSRALWPKFDDSPAYWKALTTFLTANKT